MRDARYEAELAAVAEREAGIQRLIAQKAPRIVKTYVGRLDEATKSFQEDAPRMAARNYFPISHQYQAGEYGCGSFVLALLLCFVLVGIIVFVYMLIVKPPGTLTVTYEYRQVKGRAEDAETETKICPMCAEEVRALAKICRYCSHEFAKA
jgi:hypothetical protein